eukprot:g32929.t1
MIIDPSEHEEKKKLETDAMYKLEHGVSDQEKLKIAIPTLSDIQEMQSAWKDDFAINSMLRKKFRDEKKVLKEVEEKDEALRNKASLSIPLVQESEDDKHLASLLKFQAMDSYEDKQRLKRKEITSRSWFASSQVTVGEKAGETLKKLGLNKKSTTKSTNSPNGFAASNLGIIRRKTESQKQQSLLVSREKDSSLEMRNRTDQKDHVPDRTTEEDVNDFRGETDISLQTEAVVDSDRDLNTSSLVADYSDS